MGRRKIESFCLNCGKKFYSTYSSLGKYCSNSCQRYYQQKCRVKKWLQKEINPLNSNGLLRPWARNYLFKENGSRCSICGWNQINSFTGKIPLEVDHIDGNFQNNSMENLRLLCPNCHSLTSTYKNSNKGHGRSNRK